MRFVSWPLVSLLGSTLTACAGAPQSHMSVLAVSGAAEYRQCFEGDARAVVAVFGDDRSTLLPAPSIDRLRGGFHDADGPTLVYYAGHGAVQWTGPRRGTSEWFIDGTANRVGIVDLLTELHEAPWASVIAAACDSAWVDVSTVEKPVSIVSASSREFVAEPGDTTCRQKSTLGALLADALSGQADTNRDCLVTDEELAREVNGKTHDWVLKPSFRVTRNRPTQVPVAQVAADTRACEATWREMTEYAKALGGDFGRALEQQVELAKGKSPALPIAARRFYVASSEPPALRAAASARGLPRFPGTLEQARALAKLVTFTRIVELDYQAPNLLMRDLGTEGDPGDLIPVNGSYAGFVAALPACGRVYEIDANAGLLFLRFPDAIPTEVVRARDVSVSLREGISLPCSGRSSDVVGTCFRVPFDPRHRVYRGDPVECAQPVGGKP